jgi:ribosomal-protein-serine acetyltransferase
MDTTERILLDVPGRLVTARLELRTPVAGDGVALNGAVVESIAEVAPWMPWANPTPAVEQTEVWVRLGQAKYLTREEFHFVLVLRESGEMVGAASLFRIDWSVPRGEIGYWLRTRYCGRGLMTEAVGELTRLAFEVLGMERVEILCDDRNVRSGRVAELAGYRLEGVHRRNGRDVCGELKDTRVYARVRE